MVTQTDVRFFMSYTERVLIEALNAVVTSAANMLTKSADILESDMTFVLSELAKLAHL